MGIREKMAQKRRIRPVLILLTVLAVCFLSCTGVYASYMAERIPTRYDQSEARSMLALINDYRASQGVHALQYDYRLEDFAMQRAAEIGVQYEHTRPNGTPVTNDLKTIISARGTNYMSENIYRSGGDSCTASDALSVFAGSYYHNEAMLDSRYNYVGFGCGVVDGHSCWVQIFHSAGSGDSYTAPVNGTEQVSVTVDTNLIGVKGFGQSSISLRVMDETELPAVYRMVGDVRFDCYTEWSVADPTIAAVSGGNLIGKYPGTTTLTATAEGETISYTVNVTPFYLSSYSSSVTVTLPQSEYTYTGSAIRPQPVVKVNGNTLTAGTDYSVSWGDNVTGFGRVDVTGKGRFGGSCSATFNIKKANQTIRASVSPAPITAGKQGKIRCTGYGDLSYSSSNSSVAYASYGTVYTYKPGRAVITVTAAGDTNHNSASTTVTVTVKAASSSSPSKSSSSSGGTKSGSSKSSLCGLKAPVITGVKNVSGGIQIKWKHVHAAARYRVMVRKGKGAWRTVSLTKSNTFIWKKPVSGVRYYLTVRCVDTAGRPSKYYNKTGKSTVYLKAPSITAIKSPSAKKLAVKWTKTAGAGGYQIYYRYGSGKAKYKTLKGAGKISAKLTKLKRRKTYKVMVRAWKKFAGKTYYSAWSSVGAKKVK